MKKAKTKFQLVEEWARIQSRLREIDKELRFKYERNPKKCRECGCDLKWRSMGWVNLEGHSLEMCDCLDGMG